MGRRQVIDSVLLNRPWYDLIEHDLYNIGQRIQDIDEGYFVLYNHRFHRWEVHHVDNHPQTYAFVVPFDFLDARTLEYCWKTKRENTDRLLKEMEANNEKIKASKDREFKNSMEDASRETADLLSLAIDQDELHEGYKRSFGGITLDK